MKSINKAMQAEDSWAIPVLCNTWKFGIVIYNRNSYVTLKHRS